jgi:hypothetical protein
LTARQREYKPNINMNINIEGKSRAKVLASLYNHSRAIGFGALGESGCWRMTEEEAEGLLSAKQDPIWFDYIDGRVIKIGFSGNEVLRCDLYDRDLGQGAAARAIAAVAPE